MQTPLKACHRGIVSEVQENTKDGIALAIKLGVDMIDLDVLATNDNNMVLSHDSNVKDLVIGHKDTFIKTLSREEVKKLVIDTEIGSTKYKSTNHFSFLDEVFDIYVEKIIFWIDIKEPDYRPWQGECKIAPILAQFLADRQDKLNRVIISSTNPFVMIAVRRCAKQKKILNKLTFGFDYGLTNAWYIRFAIWSGLLEKIFGSNYVTMDGNLLTQERINQYVKNNIKVMPYCYSKGSTQPFMNIYGYLMDY